MSRLYPVKEFKYQAILRKKDARHGIAKRELFIDEEDAYKFVEEHPEFLGEVRDLQYFKAL
jgi:hypothetical protein